jgi:hypothetical protein
MKKIILLFALLMFFGNCYPQTGWIIKLAPDTSKFVSVYFKNENLGCIFTGYYPIKRTTDGGITWGYGTNPGLNLDGLNGGVFSNGNDIFTAGYRAIGGGASTSLLCSSDMGLNWYVAAQFGSVYPTGKLLVKSLFKSIGFLVIEYAYTPGWRRTNNGGYNWLVPPDIITPAGLFTHATSVGYVDTSILYGINNGQNIGKSVTGTNYGFFQIIKYGVFSKICVVDSSNILAISNYKFFRSVNAGVSWDSTQFPVKLFTITFPNQNTGYITGSNGRIYKSTNKGAAWIQQITPTTDTLVDCCFLNSMTGFVIGSSGILLKTNDGGVNAVFSVSGNIRYSDNNQPATNGYVKAIKLDRNTNNIITYDSVQIQNDGSYILTNVPQDSVDIGVYPNSTTQNDWVVTYYPSTTYWQDATTLYPTGNLTNINIGVKRLSSSTASNSINGKVMRLTDSQIGNLKDAVLYAKNGNTFVRCAVSDGNGVYHLPSLPTGSLKIICNRFGFTNDSAIVNVTSTSNIDSINFHLYKVSVGIKQIGNTIPTEYKLYQNYPNPFNPSTNIRYSIAENGFRTGAFRNDRVVLKVYNILGKVVATLINEKQSPGEYEVTFDGSMLPSGIYFYKLACPGQGDFSEVRRMILIK